MLRFPRKLAFRPDSTLRHKISVFFKTQFEEEGADWPNLSDVKTRLPEVMPKWCKIRAKEAGDHIRGSEASVNPEKERDSSFVRVSTPLYLLNIYLLYFSTPS